MKAIIAVNNLGFIGLKGELPWRCSADLKHFKASTAGQTCLVGYNTLLTLPKLNGRTVYCDGSEDVVLGNIDWCIGGKKTYEKYCHLFTELHISHIGDDTIGDVVFPDLSKLNPECKIFNYHFE